MNITLEQLSVGYKGFPPVVSNINVEIKSGELTCLIGSNGIGKSTLLKTLTGFLPKLSGRLLLDGHDINMLSQRERAKYISIVLTYKSDVQNLSVTEMVGMGRMPYTGFWGKLNTSDQTIVAEAIEMVGIEHLKKQNDTNTVGRRTTEGNDSESTCTANSRYIVRRAYIVLRLPIESRNVTVTSSVGKRN